MLRTNRLFAIVVLALAFLAGAEQGDQEHKKSFTYHKTEYFLGGGTRLDNESLNNHLASLGFHQVDDYSAFLGGGFSWRHKRLIQGAELFGYVWQREKAGSNYTRLYGLGTRLNVGVNVLPEGPVLLYPQFGLGLGGLGMKLGRDEVPFADAVASPVNNVSLWQRTFVLEPGIALDWLIPKKARPGKSFLLGIRAGYSIDVSRKSDWRDDGVDITDGPELRASGPYLRVTLGKSFKNTAHSCRKDGCRKNEHI